MIDWSTVAPALKSLIEGLALESPVSPAFEGRWANRSSGVINHRVRAELILKLRSVTPIGEDERVQEDIDGTPYERLQGLRRIILEVRVESHRHNEESGNWSWSMAGRIATRLRRRSSHRAMRAVQLGLVDVGAMIEAPYVWDDREKNVALFEVTLTGAFTDVNAIPLDWFERISLTAKATSPDGTELPSPPNYQDELMPPAG